MNSRMYDEQIVRNLAKFKDYLLIRTVVDMLKIEEQKIAFLEWLENNKECSKTDIDECVIKIAFNK